MDAAISDDAKSDLTQFIAVAMNCVRSDFVETLSIRTAGYRLLGQRLQCQSTCSHVSRGNVSSSSRTVQS